ncbi:hypothetical protein AWC38_SpisGene5354 [Stylophora pistillata]|uniref:Uncharacterized protein n=1 Tax=Stylophora pistillata TaxID=50429 RepID=A0A2B4SLD8_STYPI|nr:hypothetical protein AWC38_SpisGene5354 [Stylophora pistillata]
MKPLSAEVMSRRWKMIGHILRKDRNNDCNVAVSWAPEEQLDPRTCNSNTLYVIFTIHSELGISYLTSKNDVRLAWTGVTTDKLLIHLEATASMNIQT